MENAEVYVDGAQVDGVRVVDLRVGWRPESGGADKTPLAGSTGAMSMDLLVPPSGLLASLADYTEPPRAKEPERGVAPRHWLTGQRLEPLAGEVADE